ncbi:MAG: hypothetical protein HN855_10835 [Anaerolineae bacterium]|jgi:signal transduction histidine kinase|nr:hypothetical protein [Anaerolineae bacterium]MBT7069936.1 hypothetical protein [Anaerolineae bacterium]MBT7325647.1 hypothetical protein [Anaerolineae bacterium]
MGLIFEELTSLLTDAPGNLIYHLAQAFSVAGALQVAFGQWRSTQFPQVRRTLLGLLILLLGQLASFIVSALAWQALIDPAMVLPPLDRAITLFSLIWITWLWLFPEPSRLADAGNALLNLLIITGLALSFVSWMPQVAAQAYNLTLQDSIWQFVALGFIVLAGISLFVRRPNGWNYGILFMVLAFFGHGLHLLLGYSAGNFPGIVRVFYMAAYPILLTLPQRFPGPTTPVLASHRAPTRVRETDHPVRERRRYSTDPKTFHALLSLAAEIDTTKTNHAITRAIAQTMLADLCFLIYLSEDKKQMVMASGYDLIREENLEGASLDKSIIPMLANSIQRGKPLRLPQSSTSPDLQGLGELLGLSNPGHLLSAPILNDSKESIGGVLLLSPYSNRLWNTDDQAFLSNISASLVSILERGQSLEKIERKSERSQKVADDYRTQLDSLRSEKNTLAKKLEEIEKKITDTPDHTQNIEALLALQEEAQHEINKLQKENENLRTRAFSEKAEQGNKGEYQSAETNHLEQELKATLQEVARLQNLQAQANLRILELESGPSKEDPREQAAVIASISQELRQPMSSIIGYTDLLLGESVGILGALQRKFVERIKSSIERIGNLMDDIIQVTTLEMGLAELKAEPVDLNMVIDNAMAYTSNQVREKNISIDLKKILEPIHADKEALQQILIHLLQNAGAASPVDGTVSLRVQTRDEKGQAFILIQVADTGGGIPAEDLSRVFTRLYRAENVLIQGVGDTGVGLSIAKTLTEAQHGRIWVDSEENIGSTFSVLLPIARPDVDANQRGM